MHVGNAGRRKSHEQEYFTLRAGGASAWYSVGAVAPTPPVPQLPPACSECTTTLQLAKPGSLAQKIPFKMSRSANGQLRIDYGATSVITNPATQQTLILDHIKKEVRAIPLPALASPLALPKVPGMPGAPTPPAAPAMTIKDLGKRMIQGIEVEGKQITMPHLTPPKLPGAPKVPGAPTLPEPKALVSEVWMHTKLQIPVLSRITGSFGLQMCHCTNTVAGEPHPSTFQIPADYKKIGLPPAPKPPIP
jgi:hypothetical protein